VATDYTTVNISGIMKIRDVSTKIRHANTEVSTILKEE
jgi:hypothetical protein